MRVAIAGTGTTGAYLYRLLNNEGIKVDIYGRNHITACGLNPCAWGTSRDFFELVRVTGLEPEKYILQFCDRVIMDDVNINGDLMTIDKPALVKDLLQQAKIRYEYLDISMYDRVIDATGTSRAYLPPIEKDILLPCVQRRIKTHEKLENRIKLGGIGYAWCFPLADYGYHVGCGSLAGDPDVALKEFDWPTNKPHWDVVCACTGNVRITGPHNSLPFVDDSKAEGVWGIGEAIGCVAPLAGDGIVPGMKSAQIMLKHWNDPFEYSTAILKEFEWMRREREVINKLMGGDGLGIKDAWVLKKNSKRMGMQVDLKNAMKLLKNLV